MTLTQLKYIIETAKAGTISRAAEKLYISQPSLTAAIRELEHEFGITIFQRTNKGIILTSEGEEFLGYARQVITQTSLMEERYSGATPVRHQFCVSTQHYSFAVEAFVELLKTYGGKTYDFRLRETQTYEIIEDVAKLKSEIGVLYLNQFNENVLRKTFKEHNLKFERLFLASLMCLSDREIRLPSGKRSLCRIWSHIRGFPTSREITMRSIFPRRF